MITTVIQGRLLKSCRPGYHPGGTDPVPEDVVTAWSAEAREHGVASVICLLDEQHLRLYRHCAGGTGLVQAYREAGFNVAHIPVRDHCIPAVPEADIEQALEAYANLPKPLLVHCSAGVDRTGLVVKRIRSTLEQADPRP